MLSISGWFCKLQKLAWEWRLVLEMVDVIFYKCIVLGSSSAFCARVYLVATVLCSRASHTWKQEAVGISASNARPKGDFQKHPLSLGQAGRRKPSRPLTEL
jgi:hypothetical protein